MWRCTTVQRWVPGNEGQGNVREKRGIRPAVLPEVALRGHLAVRQTVRMQRGQPRLGVFRSQIWQARSARSTLAGTYSVITTFCICSDWQL